MNVSPHALPADLLDGYTTESFTTLHASEWGLVDHIPDPEHTRGPFVEACDVLVGKNLDCTIGRHRNAPQ